MITLGCEADWRIHRLQSVLILGVVMACPVAHAEYFASLEQCLVRAASANEQYQVAYKQWNRASNDLLKLDAFDTARAAYGLVYEQLGKRLDAAFRQWRVIEGICSEIRSKNDAKELEISNRKAAEAKRIADAAKAAADAKEKASKAAEMATNPAKAAVNKAKAKLDGAAESALAKARAGDATENPSTNHIYDIAGALSAKTSQSGVITAVQKNALKEIQRQHNTMQKVPFIFLLCSSVAFLFREFHSFA